MSTALLTVDTTASTASRSTFCEIDRPFGNPPLQPNRILFGLTLRHFKYSHTRIGVKHRYSCVRVISDESNDYMLC